MAQIEGAQARLVQYDNPRAILLRNGKSVDYPTTVRFIGEKEIHESTLRLQENDLIVLMTDGITNAGVGKVMQDGWARKDVIECLERWYTPELSPQHLAAMLVNAALSLCLDSPDDDITALVCKVRARQAVNVIIGPPADPKDDDRVLRLFFAKEGKHVVCGGTTAHTVSRFLGKPIIPVLESGTDTVPAIAQIAGVDLVTEGVITLQQVAELAEKYASDNRVSLSISEKTDGVSLLAELLFEQATDITIFQGQAVNEAHDSLDIGFDSKAMLIKRLTKSLTDMGKNVKVSRC